MAASDRFKAPTELVAGAPALNVRELERYSRRYEVNFANLSSETRVALDKAVKTGTTKDVRETLFTALAERNPAKAVEIDGKARGADSKTIEEAVRRVKAGEGTNPGRNRALYARAAEFLEANTGRTEADPQKAYLEDEGKKRWQALGMESVVITIDGRDLTLGQALDECSKLKGKDRAEYFKKISAEIAEKMRVNDDRTNALGLRYEEKSSDPAQMDSNRAFNCWSGTMALAEMVMYAAGRAGMSSEVEVKMHTVAAYTLGPRWDDHGHAILRVDFLGLDQKDRTSFFDSTNSVVHNQVNAFRLDESGTEVVPNGFGPVRYILGAPMPITPELMKIARFQDRILHKDSLDSAEAAQILKMPPLFISYYIGHLTPGQRVSFFKTMGPEDVAKIKEPGLRYRIAATACEAYITANPARALAFGKLALRTMEESFTHGGASQLPRGAFLSTTINMATFMERSKGGDELITKSQIWAYIPYVISSSSTTLTPEAAADARDFLVRYYKRNEGMFDSLAHARPTALNNYIKGLLALDHLSDAPKAGAVLDGLYAGMGIDRTKLLATLRSSAKLTVSIGLTDAKLKAFLASKKESDYALENNFLIISNELLNKSFTAMDFRMRVVSRTGPSAIAGQAVYKTIMTKENFSGVLLATGPMREAAKRFDLI